MPNIYTDKDLRQLQLTILEILKVFDDFCKKYNLRYSLYAGTMIGAVRHQGFIPWDDDLDICMERDEYERFLKLWQEHPVDGYLLQNKETDEYFTQTFSKIRKRNTTFLQFESERGKLHTGIFIDIFPHDRIPPRGLSRKLYQFRTLIYLLFTREFIPPKASLFVKVISMLLLGITTHSMRMRLRKRLVNKLKQFDANHPEYEVASTASLAGVFKPFPATIWGGECIQMKFEDDYFPCFSGWKDALECEYGNYMELPPEESRHWQHHPIVLDFDKEIK